MGFKDPHNTFRPNDAFEYTDAYRSGCNMTAPTIRHRLEALSVRIGRLDDCPTYLLAAYRGYEDALCFVEQKIMPGVVKLDDTDPTPCEVMTAAGYAFRN